MRGVISPKLVPFLAQVNDAIATMKSQGVGYTVEATRDGLNNLAGLMAKGPDVVTIIDTHLSDYAYQVPVRIYNPDPTKTLPVLLHFHGGGHMCGSIALYDPISRALALTCQAIVMCIDYRLAPEYPYPSGLNDCQYLLENYGLLLEGMSYSDELFIAGDSAGGAICSSLIMANQQRVDIHIEKQILMYPSVDYSMSSPSYQENGQGFLLELEKIKWYFSQYFHNEDMSYHAVKDASPLFGEFSANIPPTLVITAGCDPLRDEGILYAEKLAKHDLNVKHVQFDGMIHAYMLLNTLVTQEYEETLKLIKEFVTQGA